MTVPKGYYGTPVARPLWRPVIPGVDGATAVSLEIEWDLYGENPVLVDLEARAPANVLDQIVSIYVDNTTCVHASTLAFEDTQYTISIVPGVTLVLPVLTKQRKFTITPGQPPLTGTSTRIILSNSFWPPFQSNPLSSVIPLYQNQVSGVPPSQAYRAKGLYRNRAYAAFPLNTQVPVILTTVNPRGTIVIGAINCRIHGARRSAGPTICEVAMLDTNGNRVDRNQFYVDTVAQRTLILKQMSGIDYILPAQFAYSAQNIVGIDEGTGEYEIWYNYSLDED